MTLDKERLRVLAEAAISTQASSEWVTHAAEFESNTTPDVVLELLSENAAKDKQLAAYAQLQKSIEERMRLSSAEHAKAIEARDSLQSERDANAILTAENAALAAEVERLRADHAAALGLVADVRFALGDNGKRMQPELIEWIKIRRSAGTQLANLAYNWSQREGYDLTGDDCELLHSLCQQWDAAMADKGEAVKVQFRGNSSTDVFDFNLFLAPGDVWKPQPITKG